MTKKSVTKWVYLSALLSALALFGGCQKHGGNLQLTRPNPVDFGDTLVWSTKVESVAWRNAGTQATDIDGIDIRTDPPFAGRGTFQAATVAINATSQAVDVTFTPQAPGQANGRAKPRAWSWLSYPVDNRPTVQEAQLRGNGVVQINVGGLALFGGNVVAGQVLDFGNVPVSTTSNVLTFVLHNSSPNAITVTATWSRANQGFAVVAPGQQFTIPAFVVLPVTLTFTPAQVGDFADSVRFSDAAGTHAAGVAVKGKGVQGG